MKMLLARHGNTFHPGEPAFYVGSQQDLPLVASGELQARSIGEALRAHYADLVAVYSGPLCRMTSTAQQALIAMGSALSVQIDPRLNELDYGLWSGLTTAEVCQQFGDTDYAQWEQHSLWPEHAAWGESAAEVRARIHDFAGDIQRRHTSDDTLLVVASNGCLRYFLSLVAGAWQQKILQKTVKIATGHLGQLTYARGQWALDFWNQDPRAIVFQPG